MRRSAEHGQATLEYLAVVALVAAVLAVGALAAAPGLANAVVRGLQRALCIVGGGDCLAAEPRACVVHRDATDETVTLHAALVRIGHHAGVLREDLSDGTVDVTEIDDLSAGPEIGLGAKGRVAIGGLDVAAGGGVSAAAEGWLGHTRTFHVRDGHSADELIGHLTHGSPATIVVDLPIRLVKGVLGLDHHDGVPKADEVTFAGGVQGSAQIPGAAGGDLGAVLRASIGGSWDRVTGRRTFYLQLEGEAQQALRQTFGLQGEGGTVVGLTFDRRGEPLQLAVNLTAATDGNAGIPEGLPGDAAPGGPSGRLELGAALDLTLGDNAQAVRRLRSALRRPAATAAVRATADLARRLVEDGRRDVRVYASSSSSKGVGGEIAVGAKGGVDVSLEHSTSHLRLAYTRPAGGMWEARIDCLRARPASTMT